MKDQRGHSDLSILEPSYEVWLDTHPGGSRSDYAKSLITPFEEALVDILEETAQAGRDIRRLRHVVLDEEYVAWLNVTGQTNTLSARLAYADGRSDEDVSRLWNKGNREWTVSDYVHFMVVQGDNIPYVNESLPYNTVMRLRSIYAHHFAIKERDIYIHPELQCPDFYHVRYRGPFIEEATQRFAGRIPNRVGNDLAMTPHHANVAARVIPVAIRRKDPPIYGVHDLMDHISRFDAPFSDGELNATATLIEENLPDFRDTSPAICWISGRDVMIAASLIMAQVQREAADAGIHFRVE